MAGLWTEIKDAKCKQITLPCSVPMAQYASDAGVSTDSKQLPAMLS